MRLIVRGEIPSGGLVAVHKTKRKDGRGKRKGRRERGANVACIFNDVATGVTVL